MITFWVGFLLTGFGLFGIFAGAVYAGSNPWNRIRWVPWFIMCAVFILGKYLMENAA